jgi:choline kinase
VNGVVLAAGPGRRLRALTAALPKTLLPLSDGRTILDLVLANLRSVALEDVVIVSGFAADRVAERVPELERRHALNIQLVFNDRAEEWNNAYSLWLAREAFATGALIVNGDTVHPPSVEETLLSGRGADVLLAVDDHKALGPEEMKVVTADGRLRRIGKEVDPSVAAGEYIGVALVERVAATPLADALEATRTASRSSSTAEATSAWPPSARSTGSRSTTTPIWRARGRSDAASSAAGRHSAERRRSPRRDRRSGRPPP